MIYDIASIDERIESYFRKLEQIRIPVEINTAIVKHLLSELDHLYTDMLYDYSQARIRYDDIQRKIEVTLKRTCEGRNDKERSANAYNKVINYEFLDDDGNVQIVNLFELEAIYRRRYYQLQDIMFALRNKADRLITDASILKLEEKIA